MTTMLVVKLQLKEKIDFSWLTGFAHVTGMCSYYSASISLDHGYYGSVLIAAHEMGHK